MKKIKNINNELYFFVIPTVFFIIDRLFKFIVEKGNYASNFLFDINYVANTGVSWGLLKGNSTAIMWLSIAIIGVIIYFYNDLKKVKLGTNFILIGAISNVLDRILIGHVIDYIDFRWFPVFNIADACISLGGLYIIIFLLFLDKTKDKKKDKKKSKKIKK